MVRRTDSAELYFELFPEITRSMAATMDMDQALEFLAVRIAEGLQVDGAAVYLLDKTGKKLVRRAGSGWIPEAVDQAFFESHEGIPQEMDGHPVPLEDLPEEVFPLRRCLAAQGTKGLLTVPIRSRGQTIGVLGLFSRTSRHFVREEKGFLSILGEQCGILIENHYFYQQLHRQVEFFHTLNEIGKALNSTLQLKEVLDLIVTRLPEVMALKGCTIRLLDPEDMRLELVASSGLSREYLTRGSIDDEKAIHDALAGGRPVMIHDARNDPRIQYPKEAEREGIASILAVPILVDGKTFGVLRLLTGTPRGFSEIEMDFAMAVAEHGGIAMKKAQDHERRLALLLEIEQQERFLSTIVDNLHAGLVVVDRNHRIVMVNRAFLEQQGLSSKEVIGRSCTAVLRDWRPVEGPSSDPLREEEPVAAVIQRPDEQGGHFIEMTTSPVRHSSGALAFYLTIVRDVTASKLLEKESMERERLQGVLEMARTAAHELNTPVFVALGSAEMLEDEIPEGSAAWEDIETIKRNLKRVSELISKMTQVTRYQSKEYAGDVTIVDLDEATRAEDG